MRILFKTTRTPYLGIVPEERCPASTVRFAGGEKVRLGSLPPPLEQVSGGGLPGPSTDGSLSAHAKGLASMSSVAAPQVVDVQCVSPPGAYQGEARASQPR